MRQIVILNLTRDLMTLTKPTILAMSVVMAIAGALLASGPIDPSLLVAGLLGTALAVSSANALNMYLERNLDAKMARTRHRPLPDHRLLPPLALTFGLALMFVSTAIFWLAVNPLATALGLSSILLYAFVYTPLKTRSPLALYIGAIPGAAPPLLGYVVVTGEIAPPGVVLFLVLVIWQLPHFLAIAVTRDTDYRAAGIQTVVARWGRLIALNQSILFSTLLLPTGLLLIAYGHLGIGTLCAVIVGGAMLLLTSLRARFESPLAAGRSTRRLFLGSLVYLPMLMVGIALDRWIGQSIF